MIFDVERSAAERGAQLIVEAIEKSNKSPSDINDKKKGKGIRKVFVGHGRNPVWSRVVNFLRDDLKLEVEYFESESRLSEHPVDVLKGVRKECDTAIIVVTAEDSTAEGTVRARQNVIHEIGFCQGAFGFDRVFLLYQKGTEEFTNLQGIITARFSNEVKEGFYELRRALKKLMK